MLTSAMASGQNKKHRTEKVVDDQPALDCLHISSEQTRAMGGHGHGDEVDHDPDDLAAEVPSMSFRSHIGLSARALRGGVVRVFLTLPIFHSHALFLPLLTSASSRTTCRTLQKAKELQRPAAVLVKEGFLVKRGGTLYCPRAGTLLAMG